MSSSHTDVVVVSDHEALRSVALDYFEGWFEGAADRMERALHPELAKRSLERVEGRPELLKTLTSRVMIDATASGRGKGDAGGEDLAIDVKVVHAHGDIANVMITSAVYIEYLHLVRTESGWRIVNALWAWASEEARSRAQ